MAKDTLHSAFQSQKAMKVEKLAAAYERTTSLLTYAKSLLTLEHHNGFQDG